jgi:Mg-chelatase subunit ChlD
MMKWAIALLVCVVVGASCPAAEEKKLDPAAQERAAFDAAAKRLAEKQAAARAAATQPAQLELEKLRQEIATLKEENARLKALLGPAAIKEPAPAVAATQPAGQPRRVLFILDASGSMIQSFSQAKEQIFQGVINMGEHRIFAVLTTSDTKVLTFGKGWTRAGAQAAEPLRKFLESVSTGGATEFLPALKAALDYRADVIWIVTDGDFADNSAVERAIVSGARGQTLINFAVVREGNEAAEAGEKLSSMAAKWGGICIGPDGQKFKHWTQPPSERLAAPGGKSIFDQ